MPSNSKIEALERRTLFTSAIVQASLATTADAGGPYTVWEGGRLTLAGTAIPQAGSEIWSYEWDTNYDGVNFTSDVTGANPTVSALGWDGPATRNVALRVTDLQNRNALSVTSVQVNNVPPSIAVTGSTTATEGVPYTVNLASSDPGDDKVIAYTVNWGDGTASVEAGPAATHTYADGPATRAITASAFDEDGSSGTFGSTSIGLDVTFGTDGFAKTNTRVRTSDTPFHAPIALLTDGSTIVCAEGNLTWLVQKFTPSGQLDRTFGNSGSTELSASDYTEIRSIKIQKDGKILIAGQLSESQSAIVRLLPSGQFDRTFGDQGQVLQSPLTSTVGSKSIMEDMEVLSDGKIVTLQKEVGWTCRKYFPNGRVDTTFGLDGTLFLDVDFRLRYVSFSAIGVTNDDKIVFAGEQKGAIALLQINSSGSTDTNFGSQGVTTSAFGHVNPDVFGLTISATGNIYVYGHAYNGTYTQDFGEVGRFSASGVADSTFGNSGIVDIAIPQATSGEVRSVSVLRDGSILVVGNTFISGNAAFKGSLVKLTPTGQFDDSFGTNGVYLFSPSFTFGQIYSATLKPDGNIYAVFGILGDVSVVRFNTGPLVKVSVSNSNPRASFSSTATTFYVGQNENYYFTNAGDASADIAAGLRFSIDYNNDGDFLDAGELRDSSSISQSHSFATPGTFIVRGRVTDKDGGFQDSYLSVQVLSNIIINGTLWADTNGNRFHDAGEAVLSNRTVYLDANNNSILDPSELSTMTDSSGYYLLSNVFPGTYRLRQILPSGWQQTYPTSDFRDISVDYGTAIGADFGSRIPPTGTITGTVWNDLDGDGLLDAGEAVLSGRTVFIGKNGNGSMDTGEPSSLTTSAGLYVFSSLPAGTYVLRQIVMYGWSQTYPTAKAAQTVTLNNGQAMTAVNFGTRIPPTGGITGKLWTDGNANGVIDTGEATLFNRTVYVDSNNNGALDVGELSTTTSTAGVYSLQPLSLGSYAVRQVVPTGWEQTFPTGNSALTVTLVSNNDIALNKNFGSRVSTSGSIAGTLWTDTNANGAVDTGEAVLASRTVFIDANNNSTLDAGEVSKVSDASGNYSFTSLAAGTYSIRQVLPSGWSQTFPTANTGQSVTVTAGQVVTGKNFGSRIPPTASIAGTLWNDTNSNGAIDTGEAVLSGRTVFVDANNNSTLDTGEKTATTSSTGVYTFTALAAGTYLLRQVIPTGWSQTFPTANAGQSVTLTNGQVVTGKNFGSKTTTVVTGGSIAGYLWSDSNANGTKESTEPFTTAREVFIDTNKNGTKDTGETSVLSDASGNYKFNNLSPGTYRVRRNALPAGYRYTSPTAGYHDVTITSGLNVTAKNIGVTDMAQVNGTVFNDANANKLKETTEAGLSGWKVFVDANDNGLWESTEKYATTSSTGLFSLNLIAGTYNLRLQSQTGKTITTPANGLATVTLTKAQLKSGLLFGVK